MGREVFVANCGSCHTLSDAGTDGTIGPGLDGTSLSASDVEEQVRNGGGAMPAFEGTLSDEEITEVAAYVAAASSG
jgi:sulfite dehydrogenase